MWSERGTLTGHVTSSEFCRSINIKKCPERRAQDIFLCLWKLVLNIDLNGAFGLVAADPLGIVRRGRDVRQ